MKIALPPLLVGLGLLTCALPAEDRAEQTTPERARANFARPIVLNADDVRAFPDAPEGYRTPRADLPRGKVETLEYASGVTGTFRKASVYLPHGYTAESRYPVLYLLHGVGGNEHEWRGYVHADTILDRLLADRKAVPMIVVMPNGRALPDDRPPAEIFSAQNVRGFENFERDLVEFLIPAVQARYSVFSDREHRALAGLSIGGGQSLNFGLAHPDLFDWVGAFSAAPNTRDPAKLAPDLVTGKTKMRLLYLSCGNRDGLINISQGVHAYLRDNKVPHVWNVDDNGHDGESWGNNLYHFAQKLFR